ncbi:MAG: hypothetical protein ACXITV_10555 [Luteibaculaceae bacterium]
MLRKIISAILGTYTFFLVIGCDNKMSQNELGVIVDFVIDLSLPQFFELSTVGGVSFVTGGFQGIIIRRNTPDEFVAFDRQCPVDPEAICRLMVDPSGLFASNPECCSATFTLFDGNITDGVSPRGMYRYNTFYNFSTNQLRITN